jgi:hypothetical protein
MDIKGKYNYKGFEVPEARVSIVWSRANKKQFIFNQRGPSVEVRPLIFEVNIWKDVAKSILLETINYDTVYDVEGDMIDVQAFAYLKTLPAYKDMVDLI